jgi:hypothetical protein
VPNGIASLARVESLSSNQSRAGLCCANDSTLRIDENISIEQDHLEASPSATAVGCERSTIRSRKACFPTCTTAAVPTQNHKDAEYAIP